MNGTYIKCSDSETIKRFKDLGFIVLSENNGTVTFLNDAAKLQKFNGAVKATYTNKLEL